MKKKEKSLQIETKYVPNSAEVPDEVIEKLAGQLLPEMKKMALEKEMEKKEKE